MALIGSSVGPTDIIYHVRPRGLASSRSVDHNDINRPDHPFPDLGARHHGMLRLREGYPALLDLLRPLPRAGREQGQDEAPRGPEEGVRRVRRRVPMPLV